MIAEPVKQVDRSGHLGMSDLVVGCVPEFYGDLIG